MHSFNLMSYRDGTEKCPFSVNENESEAQYMENEKGVYATQNNVKFRVSGKFGK